MLANGLGALPGQKNAVAMRFSARPSRQEKQSEVTGGPAPAQAAPAQKAKLLEPITATLGAVLAGGLGLAKGLACCAAIAVAIPVVLLGWGAFKLARMISG